MRDVRWSSIVAKKFCKKPMVGKVICVANQKAGWENHNSHKPWNLPGAAGKKHSADWYWPQGNAAAASALAEDRYRKTYIMSWCWKGHQRHYSKNDHREAWFCRRNHWSHWGWDRVGKSAGPGNKAAQILEKVRDQYDFVIIDCPPSLGLLTVNSLTAADSVLIPLQCEYYALEGLSQLLTTLSWYGAASTPGFAIEGIVLTMFDKRNQPFASGWQKEINEHFYSKFLSNHPRNVRLAEAHYGNRCFFMIKVPPGHRATLDLAQAIIHNERN